MLDAQVTDNIPSFIKSGIENKLEALVITGIANTITPERFRTLFDSCINCINGLKCYADSKAITLSTELLLIGNIVEVPFM